MQLMFPGLSQEVPECIPMPIMNRVGTNGYFILSIHKVQNL